MLYGKAKARQMARSILPSTASRSARAERLHIHRAARRVTRMETRRFLFVEDDADDRFPDIRGDIRMMVYERREADKLQPLMKWAEAVTRNLPDEDKLPAIKRVLPKNLIGQHAVSHLMRLDGFDPDTWSGSYRNRYRSTPDWLKPWPSMVSLAVQEILVVPGNLAALNAVVRRHMRRMLLRDLVLPDRGGFLKTEEGEDDRLVDLQGVHDMKRWWKTLAGWKYAAVEHLVVEMVKVGFDDCWVEGVFVARCEKPVFELTW